MILGLLYIAISGAGRVEVNKDRPALSAAKTAPSL